MRSWQVWYGRWWMLQYSLDRTLSLGVHLDPLSRAMNDGSRFGPYIEFHLLVMTISFGRNPAAAWNHTLIRPLWNADASN